MADDSNIIRLSERQSRGATWLEDCVLGETGRPLSVLASVLVGLRAEMPMMFGYDEMARTAMLMQPLGGELGFAPRPVTDEDVAVAQARLQQLGLKRISKDTAHQASTSLPASANSIRCAIT